nr:retrovirus-related Pol polyprotein from transposon TNT 1-94 [Tanacetum cinerariifolium]
DNAVPGVQSNVSSIPNDAYMMIYNEMYEPHAQSVSKTSRNIVVDNLLTTELATYKEQVELYERWAGFELTEREQNINEQLGIVITDHNFKEETLKKELHSIKLQLASTINHKKLMVIEAKSLKKDFKQKENKYLKDFLDMKSLKEKVDDTLFKQDQSLQIVHMLCRPKPYYNELKKVAIGYKNPLCLTREKQVQPALYNGHEIIKNNYVPAIVHNTKDTPEIAEITRRKMNDKMKDPDKQLTPEQIFWSQDLIKMKTKALKEQTTASRPIKALTVHPPNIPATLIPRRITPTGLTEGERGFEQTKECYLKEVIPFFKKLKEHFEGIQKALTTEIKEMKYVFEELEEVFYVATNSELNVARFTEMYVVNTIVEARCLELEAELSNLCNKSHNDNYNEFVNRFSNLEVTDLITENVNLKAQILNNMNSVSKDHVKPIILAPGKYAIDVEPIPSRLRNNREAHLDYLRHLKESVKPIREIVKEAKVHSCYVRDMDGVELIKGSRGSNLYTVSVEDMMKSSPICLLSKASKNKSWLWHRRLNHLNFGPTPIFLTPGQISSGLVPNPVPSALYVPPQIKIWRFYFNQCSMNTWNLLVLKDRFLLLQQYKFQSIQPVHLHLLPLIKMHLLQVFHRHLRHYNLKVYIKALQMNLLSWKTIPLLPLTIIPS